MTSATIPILLFMSIVLLIVRWFDGGASLAPFLQQESPPSSAEQKTNIPHITKSLLISTFFLDQKTLDFLEKDVGLFRERS